MTEITGELWSYFGKSNTVVLVTTNGFLRKDGSCVMGRGCAKEAADRFPKLPLILGKKIEAEGNHVYEIVSGIWNFPVKRAWWEDAHLPLISQSSGELAGIALANHETDYILPRPGCGNGHLKWEQVLPLLRLLPANVRVISKQ